MTNMIAISKQPKTESTENYKHTILTFTCLYIINIQNTSKKILNSI